MPKTPHFKTRKTAQGWLVNIPASISDTGRQRRRFFKTKAKGEAEAKRLKAIHEEGRGKVPDIRAALAEDAQHAAELLKPYSVTLTQAAAFYHEHHDLRAKAPTLADAWTAAIERRPNHRPRTLSDMRSWSRALPDWLMALNLLDLDPANIGKALTETTTGATRWRTGLRNISLVLGDCVKDGTLPENPARRVQVVRKPETNEEVSVYTPKELRALIGACKDYEDGKDRKCADCVAPFALMAFGGVRPDETGKLRWEDISLELSNIRIGATVAKKARRRNVRINATLRAWLETVPTDKRNGKVVPGHWREKATRVRREAGIDGIEKQDALRHSFGTYLLAKDNDMDALKADMGHAHIAMFFQHYHKAVTKREALEYWQVLPEGVKISTIAAA